MTLHQTWLLHPNCSLLPADLFPMSSSKSAERATASFLEQVLDILLDHVRRSNDRKAKILDWHQPNQLREAMDFSLPDQPQNLDQILVDCKDALKYQVKTGRLLIDNLSGKSMNSLRCIELHWVKDRIYDLGYLENIRQLYNPCI